MTSENADQETLERPSVVSNADSNCDDVACSPGGQLKLAREALGWSIDQVAEKLHMTAAKVRYLENDEYERLRSPTFVQGYIRSYASLLKLDPKHLLHDYDDYLKQLQSTTGHLADESSANGVRKPASGQFKLWVIGAGLLVIIVVLFFTLFGSANKTTPVVESVIEPSSEATLDVTSVPPTAAETFGVKTVSDAVDLTVIDDATMVEGESLETGEGIESAPVEPVAEPLVTTAEIKLVFSADCWVEVTDVGGARILAELKKLGEQVVLTGEPPFDLVLGNARAAQVWVDGQAVVLNPQPNRKLLRLTLNKPAISDLPSANSF